ncbi:DUF2993 domain-containing protein [Pleurocapsales cyanobacterium LEGE 06147]|nr:DUF2993 domain-containing protein [Pleurocapsales cyanobacterium LEGE 06147]
MTQECRRLMIDKVLSTAIRLWLRSQVERVEELEVKITGGDRQILGGYISRVSLTTNHAVYRGLHLRQIKLAGENIRVNLAQILKGKPLQLLEPVAVTGQVWLEETDLKASLSSPLLVSALTDLLSTLLTANGIEQERHPLVDYQMHWQTISVGNDKLTVGGRLIHSNNQEIAIAIRTGLRIANGSTLKLSPLYLETIPQLWSSTCNQLEMDLDSEVAIEQLSLEAGKLFCSGGLTVLP